MRTNSSLEADVDAEVDTATNESEGRPQRRVKNFCSRTCGRTGADHGHWTFREAIARGIAQEMRRDESVVFFGEDVGAAGVCSRNGRIVRGVRAVTAFAIPRSRNKRSSARDGRVR